MNWLPYAVLSAVFAAATAILAKVGVVGVPSTLATAIRTAVILTLATTIALLRQEHRVLQQLPSRSFVFLTLSGMTAGLSWLAYFRALQIGDVSRVAPVDKLSLPLTIFLAWALLGEPLTSKTVLGVALMSVGALLTVR